MKRCDM